LVFIFADMWRMVHFIALISYLNILCFEVKYCNSFHFQPMAAGETLIEVVLEDMLNLEHQDGEERVPEIMFDDYRIMVLALGIIPLVFYFTWLLRRVYAANDKVKHLIYYLKRLILPGYYTFLYRYRLF